MDLFRMRCLVCVAKHRNITRAAAEMGITQPAMSVQMRELERETGVAVLRRVPRGIELTEAGEAMRDGFADVLALYERTLRSARRAAGIDRSVLRTGYHGAFTAYAPLYQGFREACPDVEVSVRLGEWDVLADLLQAGEIDAAFLERHELEARPELEGRTFFDETFFCIAMGVSHPLASRAQITIDDLAGETVLMSARRSPSMDWMYRQLITNGLAHDQVRLVENVEAEIAMVASGAGVAAMPRFLAMPGNPTVVWVPVTGVDYSCEICLTWRRGTTNRQVARFADYCVRPEVARAVRESWAVG